MLNENILREFKVNVYMDNIKRIARSKAVFNSRDIKTSVIIVSLFNNKCDKNPINITDTNIIANILNEVESPELQCSILDAENGIIAIGFTEHSLNIIGDNLLELIIYNDEQYLHSPKISYTVTT